MGHSRTHVDPAYRKIAVLLGLSGAAGLMHEVLWTRRLVDFLGATSEANSRVFGSFFLGLALGAAWAVRLVRSTQKPWRAAASAEFAVALLALAIWSLAYWSRGIWPWLGTEGLLGWPGELTKFTVSVFLVAAPATAMGLIFPLAVAGLETRKHAGHLGNVWLYAVNTLGGVIGLILLMRFIFPLLGAQHAMGCAIALNVLTGTLFWLLDRRYTTFRKVPEHAHQDVRVGPALLLVSFWSGFAILGVEVAAMQLALLFLPLTFHAPLVILLSVVLLLFLASAYISRWGSERSPGMGTLFLAAGLVVTLIPLAFLISQRLYTADPSPSLDQFVIKAVMFGLTFLGPAMFVSGLVFPRAMQLAETRWRQAASAVAKLLFVNGVGGFVGAEITHRMLLPVFGLYPTFGVIGVVFLLLAPVANRVTASTDAPGRSQTHALLSIGLSTICAILALVWSTVPYLDPRLGFQLVDQFHGPDGPVFVVQHRTMGRAIITWGNQYMLGSTGFTCEQERQAHLPLVFHPAPSEVVFIGVATGISVGAALDHRGLNVQAVELSRQVLQATREHFGEYNHDLFQSSIQIVPEDGRTFIAASDRQYDVIIGDLFLPWFPGEGRLFSVEHFRAVHRALRSGGIFCQWLPMRQLSPEQFQLILASVHDSFEKIHLFRGNLNVDNPLVAIVAFKDQDLNWTTVADRCRELRDQDLVKDPMVRAQEGPALLYLGRSVMPPGPRRVNTLNNLAMELSAGTERVTGNPREKYTSGPAFVEFAQRQWNAARTTSSLPNHLGSLPDVGLQIADWFADRSSSPSVPLGSVLGNLSEWLPNAFLDDIQENVRHWPEGRVLINELRRTHYRSSTSSDHEQLLCRAPRSLTSPWSPWSLSRSRRDSSTNSIPRIAPDSRTMAQVPGAPSLPQRSP